MGLRDRFFTPRVARAIISPSGMLIAGGAAALTILAGGGLLAIPAAIAGWGARVTAAMVRGGTAGERVDPYMLGEPWKNYVLGAQTAKLRFDRTVAKTRPGPIRDRLASLSTRLDAGIADCWRVARQGNEIERALDNLSTREAGEQLAAITAELAGRQPSAAQASTIASLQAQLASAARMEHVWQETNDRLRLLDARLDELVAKAVEVSVGAGDSSWLSEEVDTVVTELEALRLALEDTDSAAGNPAFTPSPGTPPGTPSPTQQTYPPRP